MPASTSIKILHGTLTGSPTNTANTPGAHISILDACLVNGFAAGTLDSLVVQNNLATATRAAGQPFEVGSVVLISGATPAGLNGEKRVLTVTATTYTFETTGISDQTATGTITHKFAPLGWQKVYSGTNKAVYRSQDITSNRMYLRLDDSGTSAGLVRGYEAMTDVDTGVGIFPTVAQITNSSWFRNYTDGNADWVLVGDSKRFYYYVNYNRTAPNFWSLYFFGDIISYKSGDTYNTLITMDNSTTAVGNAEDSRGSSLNFVGRADFCYAPRNVTGVGASALTYRYTNSILYSSTSGRLSGSSSHSAVFPNTADNSILLHRLYAINDSPYSLRGVFPGFYPCEQNVLSSFVNKQLTDGIIGLPGRKLLAFRSTVACSFIDITGPWE